MSISLFGKPALAWRAIGPVAFVLAIAPWVVGLTESAGASHAHWPGDGAHIESIHYDTWEFQGAGGEEICAQSYDTEVMTTATFQSILQSLLYNQGWDGTGSWKVDNYFTAYSCESYNLDTASWIDIRASVVADASAYGCGSVSCVKFGFPIYYGQYYVAPASTYVDQDKPY